jgi:hypothetical protein
MFSAFLRIRIRGCNVQQILFIFYFFNEAISFVINILNLFRIALLFWIPRNISINLIFNQNLQYSYNCMWKAYHNKLKPRTEFYRPSIVYLF